MLMVNHLIILYIILVTGMAFTNCNSHLDLLFQKGIRYKHHHENFQESLANGITPFGLCMKKTPGIVPVMEDFHIKWNEILKGAERKLIELLLVESEKVIAKIQLEVDNSISTNYPDNIEAETKRLLDRNKHLERTLEQRRKKKWKKFTDCVNHGYFKPKDLTQRQKIGGINKELNQEKVTVNVVSLEGVESKRTYAEVLSKVVTKTVVTNSRLKNIDRDKIMEPNVCKANYSFCGDNKIEVEKNIRFAIENKMSDGENNEFTPEREQKTEGKVFVSHYINGSHESNCNVGLEPDNVLSANDEALVKMLANLGETEINISHISGNSNDMNNTELGGSITTDEPSTSRATLSDEGRLSGVFCSKTAFNLSHKILTEVEIKVLEKGLDFAPVQRTLNEPELLKDFEECCRRMRCKWHFRNEVSETFSEILAFRPKSSWLPPKGHASLEIFLSQLEKELFTDDLDEPSQSNLSPEEWKALRNLVLDRSIVIKGADKGSSVVVWDRADYILEAEKTS